MSTGDTARDALSGKVLFCAAKRWVFRFSVVYELSPLVLCVAHLCDPLLIPFPNRGTTFSWSRVCSSEKPWCSERELVSGKCKNTRTCVKSLWLKEILLCDSAGECYLTYMRQGIWQHMPFWNVLPGFLSVSFCFSIFSLARLPGMISWTRYLTLLAPSAR
jgi:hypothetical protein